SPVLVFKRILSFLAVFGWRTRIVCALVVDLFVAIPRTMTARCLSSLIGETHRVPSPAARRGEWGRAGSSSSATTSTSSSIMPVRGLAKSMGERLPPCDADQMGISRARSLPLKLRQVLEPLLKEVESLTKKIKDSDREIEQIARKDYPEVALL